MDETHWTQSFGPTSRVSICTAIVRQTSCRSWYAWLDHQYQLVRRGARAPQHGRLRREQRRHGGHDPQHGDRSGALWHPDQRGRPGAIHTEEFEAAGEEAKRRRAQTVPLGRVATPKTSPRRSRSWPQTTPATSPARSSMSTAASWRSSARRRWMQACPNRSNAACAPDLIQPAHVGRFAATRV